MDICFRKTVAGREELRAKSHDLSRTARNLLFALDETKSARDWLALVRGATEDDLEALALLGLIEPHWPSAAYPRASPARAEDPGLRPRGVPDPGDLDLHPLIPLSYEQLYERLNQLAREHLGLMKGYRFALEVEKCADREAMETLAWRLVAQIREMKGAALAQSLQRELGLSAQ